MKQNKNKNDVKFRIGVDIGGTFTDATLVNSKTGETFTSKVISTPSDPSVGFINALKKLLDDKHIDPDKLDYVFLATTVATNAIIEGKSASTAFVTTKGFRDMLEIARQIRPSLYDLQFEKPPPLIPRQLCFEVEERVNAKGEIIKTLDGKSIDKIINSLSKTNIDAVAICLLHSYRNPKHEKQLDRAIKSKLPNLTVSISSEVVPEFREYLRASTTVINSSISPIVNTYIKSIKRKLIDNKIKAELFVMQSNGGVYGAEAAVKSPVHMVESGPAAGAVASAVFGGILGYPNLISFDMGGTTAKVTLIRDGKPSITKDYSVGSSAKTGAGAFGGSSGYPIRTPVIDLVEIGAGGGSIAWIDSGGALRVGPESSGADPGPVCYGLGGKFPTITDANLILGRLDPNYFANGEIKLNFKEAEHSIYKYCAKPLGISTERAAYGIIEIANNAMVNALRIVSIQRGHDPREFVLVGFGGAGPAHVASLAEQVGIPKVLIPISPGTASALGLLVTDVRMDLSKTLIIRSDQIELSLIKKELNSLKNQGKSLYSSNTSNILDLIFEYSVDMRYWGQSFELNIPAPETSKIDTNWLNQLLESFHKTHEISYGFRVDNDPIEIVNLRLTTIRKISQPKIKKLLKQKIDSSYAMKGIRPVYFGSNNEKDQTPVYNRKNLSPKTTFNGPAIIEEPDSTTVIPPKWNVNVDDFGNLILENLH